MVKRLLHASFLAIGTLLVAGGVIAVSCRPVDGPSGVHVTVDLVDGGWTTTDGFDHIVVRATSSSMTSTVCLSTVRGDASAFQPDAADDGGDPCADDQGLAWTTEPNVGTWHLDQAARTINFEFPENEGITVTAEAHLGGQVAIGTATGSASSTIGGNEIDLHLTRSTLDASCPVAYAATPADASTSMICNEQVTGCLCASSARGDGMDKGCIGATAALKCNADGTEVTVAPQDVPTGCPTEDVGRGLGVAAGSCTQIETTMRLYGCLEGNVEAGAPCTATADCVPPQISVVARSPKTGEISAQATLECLPPTVFGIPVTLQLTTTSAPGLATWFGFDVTPTAAANACRIDFAPLAVGACSR